MLRIGDIVDAVVRRIEEYGVYLAADGDTILVLIPYIGWQRVRHPSAVVSIGQQVRVKIQRYCEEYGVYVGSIKAAHPELNPYLRLVALPPGTILRAKVETVYPSGDAMVILDDSVWGGHIWGDLCQQGLPAGLRSGDMIDVVIESLDADEGRLDLRSAHGE